MSSAILFNTSPTIEINIYFNAGVQATSETPAQAYEISTLQPMEQTGRSWCVVGFVFTFVALV